MLKQFRTHLLTSTLLLACEGSASIESPQDDVEAICSDLNQKLQKYILDNGVRFKSFSNQHSSFLEVDTMGYYNSKENTIYVADNLPTDLNQEVCLHVALHASLNFEEISVLNKSELTGGFISYLRENEHQAWALKNIFQESENMIRTFISAQISHIKTQNADEEMVLFDLLFKAQNFLHIYGNYQDIIKISAYQSLSQKAFNAVKAATDTLIADLDELYFLSTKLSGKKSNYLTHLEKIRNFAKIGTDQFYYNTNFHEALIRILVKHHSKVELTLNETEIYKSVAFKNPMVQSIFY